MNIPFFDLKRQNLLLKNEFDEVFREVFDSGQFILGNQVSRFEKQFSAYLNVAHCISCANGTDALEIVLEAMGLGEGDEVLIPAFGWVSPYLAVKRAGAIPILVDVDLNTGNISTKALKDSLSPNSKAIIPIHLFGNSCNIQEIKSVCTSHGLYLIEDCAQAQGVEINGEKCGSFGDVAIFSFYPTKNLGALGDAGAIVTNDTLLEEKIRSISNYGKVKGRLGHIGRNSRMDELQAGILLMKLNHLEDWNQKRRSIAKRYAQAIGMKELYQLDSIYHQFVIRVNNRGDFQKELLEVGVESSCHYPFSVCDTYGYIGFPNAELLAKQVVSLPIFPELMDEEISYICEQLKRLRKFIL